MNLAVFGFFMSDRQITAIRAQKHNPDRLSIELDGEYAFGVSRIVAAWLKVGDQLNEERVASLVKSDEAEIAFQKALRLLDYRPRTVMEIRQRLTQKGFGSEEIKNVILRLQRANLLQDEQFARMWVENRNEFHPRSKRLIRFELKNKGVSDQVIDNVLEDCMDDGELALRAGQKYARKLDPIDRVEFRKRLSAYLARRGFSYGTVAPVVQSLMNSQLEYQLENQDNEEF